MSDNFTEIDTINLSTAQAELNLIKSVIEICVKRKRY